jgi:hypothetical protein
MAPSPRSETGVVRENPDGTWSVDGQEAREIGLLIDRYGGGLRNTRGRGSGLNELPATYGCAAITLSIQSL